MKDHGAVAPDDALYQELVRAAPAEDAGRSIRSSVARITEAGFLFPETIEVERLANRLIRLGEANLSLARLYEGHVNALRLIRTLGSEALRTEVAEEAARGVLFGVWGAEGAEPLGQAGGVLTGGKRFASGLGTVGRAVVTMGQGPQVQLGLIEVTDTARHRPGTWRKTGMRATLSGDFDAAGLPTSAFVEFGAPGRYLEEPGFIGGVWRIAAVQLGGTLGLLGAARDRLAGTGRLAAEAQVARLAPVLTRAIAAGGFVVQAARTAEGAVGRDEPERAASLSAQARLLTEELGQDAIAAVEQSVGLDHFDTDAATGRIARDLATYLRQAARDALLQRAGLWALSRSGPLSGLLFDTLEAVENDA